MDDPLVLRKVLVMPNASIRQAAPLAIQVAELLQEMGLTVTIEPYDFEHPGKIPCVTGYDLMIALGGDGTLLRAGHIAAEQGIPVLGIQAGHLGFLVELTLDNWKEVLPQLLRGEYRLERRLMLNATLEREGTVIGSWDVINELVISRGRTVRPIEVRVDLREGYLTSYIADGLIVATATGSTAYALAVGGPILPPELRSMLILPIAPHLSLDRAVVLAEGARVILRTRAEHDVVLSVDGMEPISVKDEDRVLVQASPNSLNMLRFGSPNYFYRGLAQMMGRNPAIRMVNDDD
jgi:NAD+ kinase